MLIEKRYFKWDHQIDTGLLQLDALLSEEFVQQHFVADDQWWRLRSNEAIRVKLDAYQRIAIIFCRRTSQLGPFKIEGQFMQEALAAFGALLEPCEADYAGDQLILHFGDALLGAIHLIRANKPSS